MASKGSGVCIVVFDEHGKLFTNFYSLMNESIELFSQLSPCLLFLEQTVQHKRTTILATTATDQTVLQTFEHVNSVEAILILSQREHRSTRVWPRKVIGVFASVEDLFRALVDTVDTVELELDASSLLFHCHKDGNDNDSFYYYHLWRLSTRHPVSNKSLLVDRARLYFHSNEPIKSFISDFNISYEPSAVLRWLDKRHHPFPYHLLISEALRTHNEEILALVRFFLLDLKSQMKPLAIGSNSNQVYFGTQLPLDIVDRLEQQNTNDIIAFQCFLPATRSRAKAMDVVLRTTNRRQRMTHVLFKIDASEALCAAANDGILIDLATPFRVLSATRNTGVGGVQQLVTVVTLVALSKTMRVELLDRFIGKQMQAGKTVDEFMPPFRPKSRLDSSARSMALLNGSSLNISQDPSPICENEAEGDAFAAKGHWIQAANAYDRVIDPSPRVLNKRGCLLRDHLDNLRGALACHQYALEKSSDRVHAETLVYLSITHEDLEQYKEALQCCTRALRWFERETPPDAAMIARCLVGKSNMHWALRELHEAYDCIERALALHEHKVHPRNDFDIAACLSNMGQILRDQNKMERAFACARRAVEILHVCGRGDRRHAVALNNLGTMYQATGDYAKARECFVRALQALPDENHPDRQHTRENIVRLNAVEQERNRQFNQGGSSAGHSRAVSDLD